VAPAQGPVHRHPLACNGGSDLNDAATFLGIAATAAMDALAKYIPLLEMAIVEQQQNLLCT
jgi:hypothetical protein